MSNEVLVRTEETRTVPATTRTAETLAQVVEAVRRDSLHAAEVYLDETKVPHGGE